jgi:glucose-6-phosphate 1-dehydrogenase
MFPLAPGEEITANVLSLCIQPDEGMHLQFETKRPGTDMQTRSVEMEFHYAEDYGPGKLPEAYERLLLDALQGDAALFARADEIELAWQIIDPVVEMWSEPDGPPLLRYKPGGWGPTEANRLLAGGDRAWVHLCAGHDDER